MDIKISRDIIIEKLETWKEKNKRKPLILQGARQVGKTWILKEFGNKYFDDLAYFNFDKQPELKQTFENTKDIERIISALSLIHGKKINPKNTLIIFDEIQECNNALNTLKYFCEDSPEYYVVCAGSLLGVAMSRGASFPVGKVEFLKVTPVTFKEFLSVIDNELYHYIQTINKIEPLPEIFFNRLLEKFRMYFISGGMPEAIVELVETGIIDNVQDILQNILESYTLDFSKHADNSTIPKIGYIWNSLPSQLARENKKFLYQTAKLGARARDYEFAIKWLKDSGLVHMIYNCTKPALPLSAYDDLSAFKIYALDVGLLRKLANLSPNAVSEGNRFFTEFKGALTENYILQSLAVQFTDPFKYWTSNGKAEVDFILQNENNIIPIEVKSDENIRSRSLSVYRKEYAPNISIRYSLKNLNYDEGLINIPLFLADQTKTIITNDLLKVKTPSD